MNPAGAFSTKTTGQGRRGGRWIAEFDEVVELIGSVMLEQGMDCDSKKVVERYGKLKLDDSHNLKRTDATHGKV